MVEFAEWVLERAKRDGKKRLYFLARDAWPVYLAASAISGGRGLDIECRYLKASRYALRLPEFRLLGEACVDRICIGGIRVTLEKLLRRAGLTDEQIAAAAERIGRGEQLRQELTYPEIMALKPVLAADGAFLADVMENSEKAFPAAIGYLRQEGLLDGTPYALVDSGWVGTMQQTLQRLLRTEEPLLRLEGYYFGLYEIPHDADAADYHALYFGPKKELARKVVFSNCLFETICSAPEGMTLGYAFDGERYCAAESPSRNPNAVRLERYTELLERFLSCYCDQPESCAPRAIVAPRLLGRLMGRPEPWEVEACGDNQFCDDVLEGTMQPAAAHLSRQEIRDQRFFRKALVFLGLRKGVIHESAWIEGSIVRSGNRVRTELMHARLYKYFVYLRKTINSL